MSTQAVFQTIYATRGWGSSGDPLDPYFSGSGTRSPQVAGPYVSHVRSFLTYFEFIVGRRPNVVDLGCGDFTIGAQLRPYCGSYVACDVVVPLIDFNRTKYRDAGVDFRVLDICEDDLPSGDVALVRQVFQHLTNDQISSALKSIEGRFTYILLTEHLPAQLDFVPNKEIPRLGDWRVTEGSGVVLTAHPFNLVAKASIPLLDLSPGLGRIVTILYRL